MESLKERKPTTPNSDQKQIQKPARIRSEPLCCRQPKGTVDSSLTNPSLGKPLSTTQNGCCRQHGSSVRAYPWGLLTVQGDYRQSYALSLKNSILLTFILLSPYNFDNGLLGVGFVRELSTLPFGCRQHKGSGRIHGGYDSPRGMLTVLCLIFKKHHPLTFILLSFPTFYAYLNYIIFFV